MHAQAGCYLKGMLDNALDKEGRSHQQEGQADKTIGQRRPQHNLPNRDLQEGEPQRYRHEDLYMAHQHMEVVARDHCIMRLS